jgi:hypothetical protein
MWERSTNIPKSMKRIASRPAILDRRKKDDRRLADRREHDVDAPERRAGEERRKLDAGPPERRRCSDRRDLELGPPKGWKERRRTAERRIPEVREVAFAEWILQRRAGTPDRSESTVQDERADR